MDDEGGRERGGDSKDRENREGKEDDRKILKKNKRDGEKKK